MRKGLGNPVHTLCSGSFESDAASIFLNVANPVLKIVSSVLRTRELQEAAKIEAAKCHRSMIEAFAEGSVEAWVSGVEGSNPVLGHETGNNVR